MINSPSFAFVQALTRTCSPFIGVLPGSALRAFIMAGIIYIRETWAVAPISENFLFGGTRNSPQSQEYVFEKFNLI